MAIRFVTAWNGYHADQIVTGLSAAKENRLIGMGFAVAVSGDSDNSLAGTPARTSNIEFIGYGLAPPLLATGVANMTWQMILETRSPAYACRVTYINQTTTPYTVNKTAVYASNRLSLTGDPSNTSGTNVLFSGAASVVVPAAESTVLPAHKQSDWANITPLLSKRSADAKKSADAKRSLYYIRSLVGQISVPYSRAASGGYDENTSDLVRYGSFKGGDYIATPSGYVGVGAGGVLLSAFYEFRGLSKNVRVLGIGDSIAAGAGGGNNQVSSWGERACNIANNLTSDVYFSFINAGWESQQASTYFDRLPALLATFRPDVVLVPVFSPNAPPTSTTDVTNLINRLIEVSEQVIDSGAVPVFWSGIPSGYLTTTSDAFRLELNSIVRGYCADNKFQYANFDAALSNHATPAGIKSGYASDGTHLTNVGHATVAPSMAQALLSLVPKK